MRKEEPWYGIRARGLSGVSRDISVGDACYSPLFEVRSLLWIGRAEEWHRQSFVFCATGSLFSSSITIASISPFSSFVPPCPTFPGGVSCMVISLLLIRAGGRFGGYSLSPVFCTCGFSVLVGFFVSLMAVFLCIFFAMLFSRRSCFWVFVLFVYYFVVMGPFGLVLSVGGLW